MLRILHKLINGLGKKKKRERINKDFNYFYKKENKVKIIHHFLIMEFGNFFILLCWLWMRREK